MTATISPAGLAQRYASGQKIELIDVRTPVEFREAHVQFAHNVPLDQLDPKGLMEARYGSAGEPLDVICRSGARGQQACDKFAQAGFENVINVEGGT
ncbi:MAG: rhodanese-like domain-containing protein, partial [Pirellulaceae bacterium]|nr:rhodanese-like domain-containing protein [Pirellulaceae bacterium]